MSRILIAEDEPRLVSFLEKGLRANGFSTSVATGGRDALALCRTHTFDLMILDIGLPDLDGFSVLQQLRGSGRKLPVIVLTARDDVADTVAGLDSGADDYVTKPFRFEELLARVRVRLRDNGRQEESVLQAGDVQLDLRTRRLAADGKLHELSAREFALVDTLMRHAGQVLSRQQLLSHVWGYDYEPGSNVVDVYIGYLRRKIGSHRITTVRGMGYRLEAPAGERQGHATVPPERQT